MAEVPLPWELPLFVAAAGGETAKITRLLQEEGQDVNFRHEASGRTALFWAAENNYWDAVKLLIHRNADVNVRDNQGRTPLAQAAEHGHAGVINELVLAGADIESRDALSLTPLMLATQGASDRAVRALLAAGADPNVQDTEGLGRTPLSLAVERGFENVCKALMDDGNAAVDLADTLRRTPLLWAAIHGHAKTVAHLLRHNANIEVKDAVHDRTPLAWAVEKGHAPVVEMLKRKHAFIDEERKRDRAALLREPSAAPASRPEPLQTRSQISGLSVSETSDHQDRGDFLIWAMESSREDDVKSLAQQGASLNEQDENGMTALAIAAYKGQTDTVKLLLEENADPDPLDAFGRTPLSWAAEEGHFDVAELLIERKVRIDLGDEVGMAPISYAASGGHESIVSLLLDAGAYPDMKDENGRTPMSIAAAESYDSIVALLLERGASPNEGGDVSPLIFAVGDDNLELAELLLSKGANPYSDTYSITEYPPLVLAADFGNEAMLKLFLECNIGSAEVRKDHVWRALIESSREGHVGVVRALLDENPFDGMEGDDMDTDPLFYAEGEEHDEIIQLLEPYYENHKPAVESDE